MYGKVFDSIYDGTLYGHWEAIVTMQQLIVLAPPDGVVDMTPQALAARTSIPLEILLKWLKILSEPDQYTRTPGEDGRRIVLMDDHRPWGWKLVNHGKYSRLRNMDQKREADRERIAEKRNKNNNVAIESRVVAYVAHLDLDLDSDSKPKDARSKKEHRSAPFSLPEWIPGEQWQAWIDARTKKRNAPTVFACELAVAKLEWLRDEGHHPAAVLAQSAFNGWAGLFPIKDQK